MARTAYGDRLLLTCGALLVGISPLEEVISAPGCPGRKEPFSCLEVPSGGAEFRTRGRRLTSDPWEQPLELPGDHFLTSSKIALRQQRHPGLQ